MNWQDKIDFVDQNVADLLILLEANGFIGIPDFSKSDFGSVYVSVMIMNQRRPAFIAVVFRVSDHKSQNPSHWTKSSIHQGGDSVEVVFKRVINNWRKKVAQSNQAKLPLKQAQALAAMETA